MKRTKTIASTPSFLFAWIVEHDEYGMCLLAHQSPTVKPLKRLYEPVARFLEGNAHRLVYEDEEPDETMIGYLRIIRIYRLED